MPASFAQAGDPFFARRFFDNVSDQVEVRMPKTRHFEGTNFTVTVNFRNRSGIAAATPTTVHYRVDDITGRQMITDWTSVSAASSVDIDITPTENAINGDSNAIERRQLLVKADSGLSTQAIGRGIWQIENLQGIGQ